MSLVKASWIAALLAVALFQTAPAKAETFNTCAGFIDSLPVTIDTQGVWCLRKDLATSMTGGNAVYIRANNVTIDCNGFEMSGLSAGNSSATFGIFSGENVQPGDAPPVYRLNTTVRNCAIRGFFHGIFMEGAGHLVEDNRLEQNLGSGIYIRGYNNRVRRNTVYDTGGHPRSLETYGIYASADVIDNTVDGVFATDATQYISGIVAFGSGGEVRGNRVRGLAPAVAYGNANGVSAYDAGMTVADNHIAAAVTTRGIGIRADAADTFCDGNTVVNFVTAYQSCDASEGNLSLP